jgi:hypothetical protein
MGGKPTDSYCSTDISEPARATLDDEAYSAAEAKGRAMSIREAGEFAIAFERAELAGTSTRRTHEPSQPKID